MRVVGVGRLGQEPELVERGGYPSVKFSVCVNQRVKINGGWQNQANWYACVIWGRQAEWFARDASKGMWIHIDGRLEQRHWVTDAGDKRVAFEIKCDEARALFATTARNPVTYDAPQAAADDSIPF